MSQTVPLDLASLRKSVVALRAALAKGDDAEFMRGMDETARRVILSGIVKHFEFTYELCSKFMKRWLKANVSELEGITRRDLYRRAAENRLIEDVDKWMEYHEARNETSHTYEPVVAEQVCRVAHEFLGDASRLLQALEARND